MRKVRKTDPDGINKDRAAWAGKALATFQHTTRTDDGDVLKDLLCDLMHWADQNGQEFDVALDAAQYHYRAETGRDTK